MAVILGKAWDGYRVLFDEIADERTKSWFLVAKPYQGLTILGLYLMFILKWGPQFMKKRPAYNLDKLMIVYNFLQVIACMYIFYYSILLAWGWDYKWICEPVDRSRNPRAMDIAKTSYLYFIMKVIDLLDTVFFVLRKKWRQISFLHIYHHTGMVLLIWGAVTYLPGGHGTLIGVINTFVHIVMYTYYLYTVVNPSAKQSLWWKKYITQLQIAQFFWCVVHMLAIVFKTDCEYPRWTSAVFLPQNLFILILFIDFYIKNYIKKPQAQQIAELQKKYAGKSHVQMNGFCEKGDQDVSSESKTSNEAPNRSKSGEVEENEVTTLKGTQANETQKGNSKIQTLINNSNSPHEPKSSSTLGRNALSRSQTIETGRNTSVSKGRKHGKAE